MAGSIDAYISNWLHSGNAGNVLGSTEACILLATSNSAFVFIDSVERVTARKIAQYIQTYTRINIPRSTLQKIWFMNIPDRYPTPMAKKKERDRQKAIQEITGTRINLPI